MEKQVRLTRRTLGALIAGAAAASSQQAGEGQPKDELQQARDRMSAAAKQVRSVEVARETEPAFRFEP